MPALEMIVAEDRTSYDWKIRIGSKEIMRKQLYKIKQFDKCILLDLHRSMLTVKYDTMFIVVNIWKYWKPHGLSLMVIRMILWFSLAG